LAVDFEFAKFFVVHDSTTDDRNGRHTLIENGVNDRLNALGGADRHYSIHTTPKAF